MQLIDWCIVFGLLAVLTFGALKTRRHATSVSAFLAADRVGGRYLISVAFGMAALGVISLVWFFEEKYEAGYSSIWWGYAEGPAAIIMAISGWVYYRYRQTRAMTLAQFFEMRYSRNFRVFAGIISYLAGIINFGIFPAVGGRFFMALCGFPTTFEWLGATWSTFPLIMFLLLAISLFFTFVGGQIAVMVTDFLQGAFANIVFVIIAVYLLGYYFSWDQISSVLAASPEGKSMIDPLDMGKQSHFDFWFYMIGIVVMFYGPLGWQGTQGYNCAAKNAHEAKMANILAGWRFRVLMVALMAVPICVRVLMEHEDFSAQAVQVRENITAATADLDGETAEQLQTQLRAPTALAIILRPGLLGLFCAAMLAAFISTHDTYLHSWGSILVQDVILPFRKKPLTPRQHLWALRASIFFVAAFIFTFSILYRPTQYVAMFLIITGSVFVGGAGAAIIGGLYWKRGTTAAAWIAMITGSTIAVSGVVIHQIPLNRLESIAADAGLIGLLGRALLSVKTNLSGQEINFIGICMAAGLYVIVSLLTCRRPFNLDRMLHRGAYAIADDPSMSVADATRWYEKLGFTKEFSGRDRAVAYITLAFPLIWTVIFIVGTVWGLAFGLSQAFWLEFWRIWTWFIVACAVLVTAWFTIGGMTDLRFMFRALRERGVDYSDDGRVDRTSNGEAADVPAHPEDERSRS
jgi:SSS family solute:Na+ symporter